jgi:hypothetical protein
VRRLAVHGVHRGDLEANLDDAVGVPGHRVEPCPGEHRQHRPIGWQHRRDERPHAVVATGCGEVLEQDRRQPSPVVGVIDEEGHLGLVGLPEAVVAADADQVVIEQGDERHPLVQVDVGEVPDLRRRQRRASAEEPEVDRLGRLPAVERHQTVGVVGGDRPHVHGPAVGGRDIGLPVRRPLRGPGFGHDAKRTSRRVAA